LQAYPSVTCYVIDDGWAGFIAVAVNADPKKYFCVTMDCSKTVNVVSTRGTFRTDDCLAPLHRFIYFQRFFIE